MLTVSAFANEFNTILDSDLENIVLQLRWYHQFQFAGYYAAIEKGYYKKAGLNVIIKQGHPRANTIEEVLSNRAEYGISNSEILLHRTQGKPLIVLAVIFQHSPLVFMTVKTSGIQHPHDMAGKRIGVSKTSRDAELLATLINEGVTLDQILPPIGGKYKSSMYYDGSADAASAYLTNEPFILEQKKIDYHIIKPLMYGIDFYGDCLFTSEKELKNHPERVKKFRNASLQGWKYAMDNSQELIDIIINKYKSDKSRLHLIYEADKMQELILPKLVEIGHMNKGRWQHIAETFVKLNQIKPDYSLEEFMYDPESKSDYFKKSFFIVLGLSFFTFIGVIILVYFNQRLRKEISEKKQAEEKLRFQAMLLEQIKDGIVATDLEGNITYINEAATQFITDTQEYVIGKNIQILDFKENQDITQDEIITHTIEKGRWKGRVINFDKNGEKHIVDTRTWKVYDINGIPKGMVGITTDITDLVKTTEILSKAKEEAESANLAKSEFLANMSHEIRTPMNAILGFSEILLDEVTNKKHKNYLENIYTSGNALLSLINDILDLSKIEAGKLEIQSCQIDIKGLLHEIKSLFTQSCLTKQLEFTVNIDKNIPEILFLDEVRIRQILTNLVGNAVKFTDQGYVTLSLYKESQIINDPQEYFNTLNIVFEVCDTGPGIPENKQELIFESFQQQSGHIARKYGGTGLGLSITKKLVNMMKGKILLESHVNKGSSFKIKLFDVKYLDKTQFIDKKEKKDNINVVFYPAVILIVDDEPFNRELVKEFIKNTPITIMDAESGEQAIDILSRNYKPDLILMDIRMPGQNGYEIVKKIKENKELKHIPVIACTAASMKNDESKTQNLFNGYLLKPLNKAQLILELKKFLPWQTIKIQKNQNPQLIDIKIPDAVKYSPEIVKKIQDNLLPRIEEIKDIFYIDEIADFAQALKANGLRYNIKLLEDYGQELYENTQDINIENIENLLNTIPQLIKTLGVRD